MIVTRKNPDIAPRGPDIGMRQREYVQHDRAEGIDNDDFEIDRMIEGETRLCMMGPSGALFETDYHACVQADPVFSVLWLNADATGFMDESKGDRILCIRDRIC